ncbi:manganese catalase family protein [Turicibacter sanguinis]|nr:manganese catalase family protein [Turicibacter sanguinis]
MWIYEKKLQYPVDIKKRDVRMAKAIYEELGGSDGELSASMEYLQQRYTMPTGQSIATLTDIGTEELAHLEIVSALIFQLTEGATIEEIKRAGFDGTYASRGISVFLADPEQTPWTSAYIDMKGDPVADIASNMGAEQRARAGYEHLLDMTTDEDGKKVLSYLREREIVHFQRFGETLVHVQEHLQHDKYFFQKK